MNKIIIILDIMDDLIKFDTSNIGHYTCNFEISLNKPINELNNFKYGLKVSIDGNIRLNRQYPSSNTKYVGSDQKSLIKYNINNILPESTCEIYSWYSLNNNIVENTKSIIIPKPESPFGSWIWDDKMLIWVPPISKPKLQESEIGKYRYVWNEKTVDWEKVIEDDY